MAPILHHLPRRAARLLLTLLSALALLLPAAGPAHARIASGPRTAVQSVPIFISLSISDVSGIESAASLVFTVSLSTPSPDMVTVAYATSDGTAIASSDYTPVCGTLAFAPGQTTATITVPLIADTIDEPNEIFALILLSPTGALIADGAATGTIQDDDTQPAISVDDATCPEATANCVITILLSQASTKTVTIDLVVNNATATAPGDYSATSGTLAFAPGETIKQFLIAIIDDSLDEDNETFSVVLSNPANATLADGTATGTINDNDSEQSIYLSNQFCPEATATCVFTVSLLSASGRTVTIHYATSDNTATAPGDYSATSGNITFSPGQTSKQINVSIINDSLSEADETFTLTLSDATNGILMVSAASGTIQDNDALPSLSINDADCPEGISPCSFTVVLSAASVATITVGYGTIDGEAVAPDDYTAELAGTVFFLPGETVKTIQISIISDTTSELAERFYVALSAPSNATIADGQGTGTIPENSLRTALAQDPNAPPFICPVADQVTLAGAEPVEISFTIGGGQTAIANLNVTVSSSNEALVPLAGLLLGGTEINRTLTIASASGQTGEAIITLHVSDGLASSSASFKLTVQPQVVAPPPWLVLLYLAGDDVPPDAAGLTSLSEPLKQLLGRLTLMAPNPSLRLVVLTDGNLPSDSHLYVRDPGSSGLSEVPTPSPWPGGFSPELDMGSLSTLRNFILWSRATYPGAAHTMLAVVGHGGGWAPDYGGVGQPSGGRGAQAGGVRGLAIDASANGGSGTSFSTKNIGQALDGLGRFDLLFLDACLMGMLEVAAEVQPYADYLLAGQNLLWSRLPYERYLGADALGAATTPRELAVTIVQRYNQPAFSDEPFTIAALESSKVPDLVAQVGELGQALTDALSADPAREEKLRAAYAAAQKFDYDVSYALDLTDGYVDLADFARQLQRSENSIAPAVDAAARAVEQSIVGVSSRGVAAEGGAVIAISSINGTTRWSPQPWSLAGAHGLSIYLPLGERDCRPSGVASVAGGPQAVAPCIAPADASVGTPIIEPQLAYYANPNQLAFTRSAPQWAALLTQLDPTTPARSADRAPLQSPFPVQSTRYVFLPSVVR